MSGIPFHLAFPVVDLEATRPEDLRARLERVGLEFLIEPHVRFAGEVGEQATLFIEDPSGNGIEFKPSGTRRGCSPPEAAPIDRVGCGGVPVFGFSSLGVNRGMSG